VLFRLIGVGAEFRVHAGGLDIAIPGGEAEQLIDEAALHVQEIAGLLTLRSSGKSSLLGPESDPLDIRVKGKKIGEELQVILGQRLKAARLQAGLWPSDVTARTGVTQQQLSLIEAGQQNITLSTISLLAAVVGSDIRDLLG
jgi:DNA-binding XRE family transcriptional regulator